MATDLISGAEQPAESAIQHATAPTDITHQVIRLARAIDRLPEGEYIIRLEKGDHLEPWRAVILIENRQVIRVMDLFR